MRIQPTIGRVVWFYTGPTHFNNGAGQAYPALVCFVHEDGKINIAYFNESGVQHRATNVTLVQEDDKATPGGFAIWMPYQIGQTKAQAERNAETKS
jgi:hypothetical protein